MDIRTSHRYAADPLTVHAMMVSPAWLEEVASRSAATSHRVEVSDAGTVLHLEVPAPPLATRFVGPTLTMTQEMVWSPPASDGSRLGSMRVTVAGAPADIAGEATLRPSGDGATIVEYVGHVTISVPLFGRKLEEATAPYVQDALDAQQAVGNDWLARKAH
ncbi:MAG TPA: DUF2505 domain-containing protein [Propionibacteriaceae bacterium]|nr:DUF2505 domain-containing protein [Propionibacteriaceae bacterium]